MTDVRKVLEDVLTRDAEMARSGAKNDCNCIFLSREAEREYETGTCPHQRARQFLSTVASEQVGEEVAQRVFVELAKAIPNQPFCGELKYAAERPDILTALAAILSRLSLREGVKIPDDWKLVPIEPTVEMMQAGYCAWLRADKTQVYGEAVADHCYSAMLTAAPLPSIPTDRKG